MKKMLRSLCFLAVIFSNCVFAADKKIELIEFKDAAIEDATRILAAMTGSNIAVTQAASGVQVNLLLRDVYLKHAVDTLSRVSGLWYRYSKSNDSYLIMTEEQYQGDIVVYRDDIVRTFTLRHQNTESAAQTIKNLYGDRVELTLEDDNNGFDGLNFDTADEATVVARRSEDDDENNNNTSTDNNNDDTDDKDKTVQLADQELSSGVIKQLGETENVDSDKASRLLGATTPIYVTTNAIHNLLFVRTSDENAMAEIEKIVQETDRPTPQVLLEMKIVRISVGDEYEQDFDLSFNDATAIQSVENTGSYNLGDSAIAGVPYKSDNDPLEKVVRDLTLLNGNEVTSAGFSALTGGFYQYYSKYVNARVSLLEKNDQAEAIAKPVVMASNNRPARLFIGEEKVIATSLDTSTLFSNANDAGDRSTTTTSTLETERRKVGNTLILLPSINADRTVTIDILQETSTVKRNGLRFPYFDNSDNQIKSIDLDSVEEENVKTVVVAKDGYTIALGGMIDNSSSEAETKVPLLGDLPFLGDLFKSKNTADTNSQYVMLLTPHILLSPEESQDKSREISEFDYDTHKEPSSTTPAPQARSYEVADYVALNRYAYAHAHDQPLPELSGLLVNDVAQMPLASLLDNTALVAWPVSSAVHDGLHITTVKVRNQSNTAQQILLPELPGGWLAATADQDNLAPFNQGKDSTHLYLLSDKPMKDIMQALEVGGR